MMLDLSNLKVDIEGSRILNGISLSVAAGELVCLVGRNGAGKTTTFRSIMGYRRARSGGISFEGADLTKLPTWQIAQRGIGFSPEESEVYTDLTVAENLELSTWTRPSGRAAGVRIEEAYTVFPKLRQYLARGGGQLSGGERKMMAVLRGLVHEPEVVFADEPIDSADAGYREQILQMLCGWQRGGDGRIARDARDPRYAGRERRYRDPRDPRDRRYEDDRYADESRYRDDGRYGPDPYERGGDDGDYEGYPEPPPGDYYEPYEEPRPWDEGEERYEPAPDEYYDPRDDDPYRR